MNFLNCEHCEIWWYNYYILLNFKFLNLSLKDTIIEKTTDDLLVCKACGYKIKAKKLKTVCPACSVDKKFFQPFNDNISPVRRTLLEFHLHPIVIHFSISFSVLLFISVFVSFFTGGKVSTALYGASLVISLSLPFFVIAGLITGVIDGVIRFKKARRPILLNKIYLSIGFLIISIAIALIIQLFSFEDLYIKTILSVLCFFSAVFSLTLGKLGGRLTDALLPGK